MNFHPASVVAAAAAAAHSHAHTHSQLFNRHRQQQLQQDQLEEEQQLQLVQVQEQIIALPRFSNSTTGGQSNAVNIGVAGVGGGLAGENNSRLSPASASPKIMEWTNDDALELIEQYRCHTELWNRADPKYKDKLCRFRAWSEIADRFGCSKAEVERKMNVLLTQYRREKHKMFVKIYQGIQPNPSKWYAFKRFDFMEAGGGSLSGLPSSATVAAAGGVGAAAAAVGGVGAAGSGAAAVQHHNGLNGLAAVAAAAYESSSVGGGAAGAVGRAAAPVSHHRRMKTKELKYFSTMGINMGMLIASSQTRDSWNTVGQYSPPIGARDAGVGSVTPAPPGVAGASSSQLRVPLPLGYGSNSSSGAVATTGTNLYAANAVTAAVAVSGAAGGGSSSSDFQASPVKSIDTSDNEDNNNKDDAALKVECRSPLNNPAAACGPAVIVGSAPQEVNESMAGELHAATTGHSETGSSPIPNTNTHEAHRNPRHSSCSLQSNSPLARVATPRAAHEQQQAPHHHHQLGLPLAAHALTLHHGVPHQAHQQAEDLDIKQELVDFFHTPPAGGGAAVPAPAPAPPESHRSYSSAEESRLHAVAEDYAQDLRVAAAAKASQGMPGYNFGPFVLPSRNSLHRRSNSGDSLLEEKFADVMPLNMRKLNAAAAAVGSSAGHMLISSLISSRESNSDADNDADADNDEATESAASPLHLKSSVSAQDASSAAAAATAFYGESLSRDDCDFTGSTVSLKLRAMDRTQRIIAERLIGEVLYYGQLNELERSARIQPK